MPTFASAHATRIVAGRVTVKPKPAAGPFSATMVGLVQLEIARATRPPLYFALAVMLMIKRRIGR